MKNKVICAVLCGILGVSCLIGCGTKTSNYTKEGSSVEQKEEKSSKEDLKELVNDTGELKAKYREEKQKIYDRKADNPTYAVRITETNLKDPKDIRVTEVYSSDKNRDFKVHFNKDNTGYHLVQVYEGDKFGYYELFDDNKTYKTIDGIDVGGNMKRIRQLIDHLIFSKQDYDKSEIVEENGQSYFVERFFEQNLPYSYYFNKEGLQYIVTMNFATNEFDSMKYEVEWLDPCDPSQIAVPSDYKLVEESSEE